MIPDTGIGARLRRLQKEVNKSRREAYAEGTYTNLRTQWLSFITFCISLKLSYLPASLNTICLYAQHLSQSFKSIQSIKNYLNGVRILHLYQGFQFPSLQCFDLKLLLKGITKRLKHTPVRASPITPTILLEFREFINLNSQLGATIWCAFIIAFYTMSRKSNICPPSIKQFNRHKHMCRNDIICTSNCLVVIQKWSKTNQCNSRRHLIPLPANNVTKHLCPISSFNNMTRLVPAKGSSPAYIIPKKQSNRSSILVPLTHSVFVSQMRKLLAHCGYDPKAYTGHSFRRGGATWASQMGMLPDDIKAHGDWKSNAYERYIQRSLTDKINK